MKERSIVYERAFSFALLLIPFVDALKSRHEYILSDQLLRSGTSIGANIREALETLTIADYTHKMNTSQKECAESIFWLELIKGSGKDTDGDADELLKMANQLLRILRSIVKTSRQRIEREGNFKTSSSS